MISPEPVGAGSAGGDAAAWSPTKTRRLKRFNPCSQKDNGDLWIGQIKWFADKIFGQASSAVQNAYAMQAGFFRYLTKPIKVREFMETLEVALEFAALGRD